MILITGSAGYIGSELCSKFEKQKINYVGIDNLKYSYNKNIFNKKKFKKCCFSNKSAILNIINKFKIKTIIHAAAFSYVNDAEINKKKYYLNNTIKTKKFINVSAEAGVKNFIFLSSSNVYSENNKRFYENTKTNPKNFYGRTKSDIEKFLLKKKNKFHNLIILRLFNIIGLTKFFKPKNFGNFRYQRILFKMFFNIKKNIPIKINYINKKKKLVFPSRDFLDIRDFCQLIIIMLKSLKKTKSHKIYNVGSGKSLSLKKILKLVIKINKSNFQINYNKIEQKEYINTKSSISKAKRDYNWSPKKSINSSIMSYKKNMVI